MNTLLKEKCKALLFLPQKKLTQKQFIIFSSIVVGLFVGLAAIALKTFAHFILVSVTFSQDGVYKYLYLALPMVGILLTLLVIKTFLKNKLDKGLSHVHYAIAKKSSVIPKEQTYAQILTSSLTVGFGGSAGLEAPIVITGAAFGANYSKSYQLTYKERTLLLACGVAAGIGATFNAPIAGVLFALEVLLIDISITAFAPLILAAASGALISKIILENEILLSFEMSQPFNYHNVPFYLVLGVCAGAVSVYHARVFTKIEKIFHNTKSNIYRNAILGGVFLGILILIFPTLFGEGFNSIKLLAQQKPEEILNNSLFQHFQNNESVVLIAVGVLIFAKTIATAITIGSGGNGGNFAPSLFIGAYMGFFFSKLINSFHLSHLPISNFTLVGMAGVLSGLYHAPLTAIFLIAEITGGYSLIIPLMLVSSISFAISKYFESYPMDTKSLSLKGDIFTSDRDHNVLTTIDVKQLIETNFQLISPNYTLGQLVEIISKSRRNIFPVINEKNDFLGIIILDDIRDIIFKTELYNILIVNELMIHPPAVILSTESMEEVMKKFDETEAWNLPVTENGKYLGFISKSSVFSSYRLKLKDGIIE